MKFARVLVLVEGQTEETFVRDVLYPYLEQRGVYLVASILKTKCTSSGTCFKGGVGSWAQVEREVRNLLRDTSAVLVTTMLDYYGLPSDFPGMRDRPKNHPPEDQVRHVEKAFGNAINDRRFLPFLVLHEFEALLFAEPHSIGEVLNDPARGAKLARSVGDDPPEAINDGENTHPAARIRQHFKEYQKLLHGPRIAAKIGLERIRQRCPHFDAWVAALERLS